MREQQGASQQSMGTTEISHSSEPQFRSVFSKYFIALFMLFMGFYFLVFGVVQLVANYTQKFYETNLVCTEYECKGQFRAVSFSYPNNVYFYLQNSKLIQNSLEYAQNMERASSCPIIYKDNNYKYTNEQMDKSFSKTGKILKKEDPAYPCGQIFIFYPQGQFLFKNQGASQFQAIYSEDLSLLSAEFSNRDLDSQWADVQNPRFHIWGENNIALGLNKYWGYTDKKLSDNFSVFLSSSNKLQYEFVDGLKIRLSDNSALSGYNVSLCAFNVLWALFMFLLAAASFWIVNKDKNNLLTLKQLNFEQFNKQDSLNSYSLRLKS